MAVDPNAFPLPLASEFPAATEADWRRLVEGVLKGADFERRLVTRTADGIAMSPIYPRDPKAMPVAGARGTRPWGIVATLDHPDAEAGNRIAIEELEGGADTLTLAFAGSLSARGFGLPDHAGPTLQRALAGIHADLIALRIDAAPFSASDAGLALAAFASEKRLPGATLNVDFGMKPLADWARIGRLPRPWGALTTRIREAISALVAAGFRGPFVSADARPFHEAGASEAQELACLIGQATAYLRLITKAGIALDDAAGMISFTAVADQDQFLTIAKLRALRRLWAEILALCGASPRPARIHAETGFRMMTRRDPNVNMLRTTIAGLAAGIGGADSLTLLAHSSALGLPDEAARRLARNTALILLKEANLNRMIDPAAGAGAIEALTEELCEKAWSLFRQIEAERSGPYFAMPAALESGLIARQIAETREARLKAVSLRKLAVTGVSEFPDLTEPVTPTLLPAPEVRREGPFPSMRLAEPFETLRDRAEALGNPAIFLAPLGRLADFTPRATFAKNAYEAGGIRALLSDGFPLAAGGTDTDALIRAFRASGTGLVCLVGADADYAAGAAGIAAALKAAGAGVLHLAGKPGELEPALNAAGISGYLQTGMDLAGFLDHLLAILERKTGGAA